MFCLYCICLVSRTVHSFLYAFSKLQISVWAESATVLMLLTAAQFTQLRYPAVESAQEPSETEVEGY